MAKLARSAGDARLRRGIRRSPSSGNFAHGLFAGSWLQASEKLQCSLFQSILPVTFAYRVSSGHLITQEGSCPVEVFYRIISSQAPSAAEQNQSSNRLLIPRHKRKELCSLFKDA